MKVLLVTQYFWPEDFRINDLVTELDKRGHEIVVLTGLPNYPEGKLFEDFEKQPKSYDKFSNSEIIRVPIVLRGKNSAIRLVLNYISFVVTASLLGAFKLRNKPYDVIFVYEPSPVTVCLPAIFLKMIKRKPVVFWVQDLWPETLEAIGIVKSRRILSLVGKLVGFIYNRCDLILGQSMAFYSGIAKYCKNKSKIHYFPNWSEDFFSDDNLEPNPEIKNNKESFNVLFAGNLGEAQDLVNAVNAFKQIKDKNINAKLFLVGDGRAKELIVAHIKELNMEDDVILLGRHPVEEMPSYYKAADALLVTLKESPVFSMTIPGKVQTYLAAGKPILTMLTGEGSRVIEEAGAGLTAKSGDFLTLAENIEKLSMMSKGELRSIGERGRLYYSSQFDRSKLISKLERWFEEVVS